MILIFIVIYYAKMSNVPKQYWLKYYFTIDLHFHHETYFHRVNSARGSSKEFDGPYPMSASASESDGVFVIADPLIGDIDKSNKYTLPINAED